MEQQDRKGIMIIEGLYLGGCQASENLQWLNETKIEYILNASSELKNHFDEEISYLKWVDLK